MKRKVFMIATLCMTILFSVRPLSVMACDGDIPCPQEETKILEQGGGAKYADLQSYS